MTPAETIRAIESLEKQGYNFTLLEGNRFKVVHQVNGPPEPGTPIYNFCQRFADQIKLELFLRPDPPEWKTHEATAQNVSAQFGATIMAERTTEDMLEQFLDLVDADSPDGRAEPDKALTILAAVVGELSAQPDKTTETGWAWQAFRILGKRVILTGETRKSFNLEKTA